MPGTVRRTSLRLVDAVPWMTSCGTTVTERGVSSSGPGVLTDEVASVLNGLCADPLTVTGGKCAAAAEPAADWAATGAAAMAAPTAPVRRGMEVFFRLVRVTRALCMILRLDAVGLNKNKYHSHSTRRQSEKSAKALEISQPRFPSYSNWYE